MIVGPKIARNVAVAIVSATLAISSLAQAQQAAKVSPEAVAAVVKNTWKAPADGWQARVDQDDTQRICSETRNNPSKTDYEKILARELATIVYPADGVVLGNWKAGEAVAQTGTGGQFSDKADGPRGGNCYACHQMSPKELSYGTLGPSLVEYGKIRKYAAADAKAAYAKIFNAQSVLPCSNMPRFGFHKFLSEQQLKDVTAFLFDPESPVNTP
jgi:L-cysteine S-thiosulfotransferase